MKVYEATLKPNTEVEAFSLVLDAAVETKLSKFANEIEKPIYFANEEKRVIFSVALRPNKMIFRKDVNGEPANVYFSKETVERLQQSYFKNASNGKAKFNLHHSQEVEGVYPIESWIVNNPEIDKSKTLMMKDVQEGDLILGYKIDNNEVWEKFVKTGEVDGLSIEAYLDYQLKPSIKMSKQENFFKHMLSFFQTEEEVKEKEEVTMVDEPVVEEVAEEVAENWEEKYNQLLSENADLKEKLAVYEAKEIEANTALETMKKQIEKFAIENKPNEVAKTYDQMTNAEKAKFNRGKL